MKWTNKGHQYDEVGNKFKGIKEIYIYGAGINGETLRKKVNFFKDFNCEIKFLDNDILKQEKELLNTKVISFDKFSVKIKEKHIIIIAASYENTIYIAKSLEQNGYEKNINYFTMQDFIKILPIFLVYHSDKVYFPSMSFLPSTICNLNCNACLNFNPFIKTHKNRKLKDLKEDIDIFFQNIDYIDLFHISGGEPLLYNKLELLVEYIGENYREQIYEFTVTTNGTIVPSDSLCKTFKKYDANIILDDYSETVDKSKDIINEIVNKLENHGIEFSINKAEYWVDLCPLTTDNTKYTEEQLINHYDSCENPFQEIREGKLYSCNYSSYAMKAGLHTDSSDEYYDLLKHDINRKKELIEFRLGYTNKGYVDFCKKCSGLSTKINKNIVKVAKQVPYKKR